MGEPRGHWEGNTLVVETSRFKDDPVYRGSNPATLTLIERFTLAAPDKIDWSVTVDDPTSWARPWTFAMPLTRNDAEAIFEYGCHEGNLAMPHLLSAARAAEAAGGTATDDGIGDAETPAARPASRPAGPTTGVAAGAGSGIGNIDARSSKPEAGSPVGPLSGEWRLTGQSARGNFAGYATPTSLRIKESSNEVTIEGNTGTENQMTAATYRLDGAETVVPGPLGWDTRAKAARKDGALVIAVTRTIDGPDGKLRFEISDVYRVDERRADARAIPGQPHAKDDLRPAAGQVSVPKSSYPEFVVLSFERPEGERFAIFRRDDWLLAASPSQWGASPTTLMEAMEKFVHSLELITEESIRARLRGHGTRGRHDLESHRACAPACAR